MGDDFDVDALLEAPFNKEPSKEADPGHLDAAKEGGSTSPGHRRKEKRSRSRDRDRDRDRSDRDKDRRRRSRSRDRKDRKDRRRSRSRDKDKKRSRSKERGERRRSRSRDRRDRDRGGSRRRSRSRERGSAGGGGSAGAGGVGGADYGRRNVRSRTRTPDPPLTPEERDGRTVFIMQLSQRVRARDVEEFFSSVGKIRDVKLIVCNKTRRFKGIAYVEFRELESVPLALGLHGQKLLGVPVIVQPSQAEKNRTGQYIDVRTIVKEKGPMRLYIGSLHFNITEEMLRGIFEPFGKIQSIQLIMDTETQRSKGYGFVTYTEAEDAKKALEQMNGFELAGRPMKVGHVTERNEAPIGPAGLDMEEMDKTGMQLGATGRLALMAKLAEGTGMKLPEAANQALTNATTSSHQGPGLLTHQQAAEQAQLQLHSTDPPIATQCFMLSNMFTPGAETAPDWDMEVRDDVIEECSKSGGVQHIYVDKDSPQGNVYVKCPDVKTAVASVNALHGRWFAGKIITAAYVPLVNYHNLFPDAIASLQLLSTNR